MKLATVEAASTTVLAAVLENDVINLTEAWARAENTPPPVSVSDVILFEPQRLSRIKEILKMGAGPVLPPDSFKFVPPHLPQANVFCVGVNYREHAEEGSRLDSSLKLPDKATYFSRDSRSFCGAFDDIVVTGGLTSALDWEAELGVIIGRGGRAIPVSSAINHVFGYVIINDISARDVQMARGQWFLGKNLSRTAPIGPYVVTTDEITDPQGLELICTVDGIVKQKANTINMLHCVAEIIADLSHYIELRPGDIISTGTPSGVGAARQPPEFLQSGSRVEVEISGLGRQSNVIRLGA